VKNKKQVRALVDRDDRFQVIYLGITWSNIKIAENNVKVEANTFVITRATFTTIDLYRDEYYA